MSSTGTTTDAAVTTTVGRQTYWCHECDMSVSLLLLTAPATTLRCPYCQSDFLEEMDSNPSDPNPTDDSPPLDPIHHHNATTAFHFPTDDNFLLDSPYLHRLIHHLTHPDPDGSSPSATATTITTAPASRHHCPAAKSAVEAIPTVRITGGFLELDPIVLCAVCKDQFVVDDETKQLPCKHMYHPDCILPWLSQHNSCPVCRFQLPVEEVKGGVRRRRPRILRLGELMEDDEELFGFESTLRHIARRHRLVFPVGSRRESRERDEVLFSPTQIGEEGEVGLPGEPGRADSVETVSSGWPSWPVDAGVVIGSDNGNAAMGNEEGDTLMS